MSASLSFKSQMRRAPDIRVPGKSGAGRFAGDGVLKLGGRLPEER